MQSDNIDELAKGLLKLQTKMEGAKKDSQNPYFKSNYADLESIWESVRPHLKECGLCVTQTLGTMINAGIVTTTLVTTLMHESGQYISGEMPLLLAKVDPQGQGSAITYARRYSLAAILGVYQVDDDAESAKPKQTAARPAQTVDRETGEVFDWGGLKRTAIANQWPEGFVSQWFVNRKKSGLAEADIWKEAQEKFGKLNLTPQAVEA